MIELSKKTRKELRSLLIKAYGNELEQHLLDLSKQFDAWKDKKITCWDLEDHIDKFHSGIAKDLFDAYNARGVDNLVLVASALARNLLSKEDIPEEAIDIVEQLIKTFRIE